MLDMINKISWVVVIVCLILIVVLTIATKIIVKVREKREFKRNN